jgi:transaldolase
MYKEMGIDKSRILIKIASTYEGIQAAKLLETYDGIKCNLTLCFSLIQAACDAEAGITLISPFVGRILDCNIKKNEDDSKYADESKYEDESKYQGVHDPGVVLVHLIYHYLKKFNYDIIIMGASIRNINEAISLAGCDRLNIPFRIIKELTENYTIIEKKLDSNVSKTIYTDNKLAIDKKSFHDTLNNDEMANEKLQQGIESFSNDTIKIENLLLEGLMSQLEFKELSSL